MELYLIRHGVAATRDPSRWPEDRDRPLTPEGEDRFRKAARGLGKLVPAVERVFASELARAWRTAELLHEEIEWPQPEKCVELEPGATAELAVRALVPVSGAASVALVGHEPNLSDLAALLLTGDQDGVGIQLKKGAVISLEVDGLPGDGDALLRWALPPKALRAL
jgi:phosphohistidine phosphatase